jgi:PAS domain S-box-containing protein
MDEARVLLVDDHHATLRALSTALELRLYRVSIDHASSAEEAITKVTEVDHDVVVSDIKMPGMDGVAMLAHLTSVKPWLPVLLMSGHIADDASSLALKSPAFAFLQKPIQREQLAVWVKRAIEMSRLRRALAKQRLTSDDYAQSMERIVAKRTRELEDNETVLWALIDTLPCIVVLTDPAGNILMFNRAAEEFTGYSRDEIIGKAVMTFIPASWQPVVLKRYADPSAQEVRAPHRNPWVSKSGDERMIEWRCTPFLMRQFDRPCVLGVGVFDDARNVRPWLAEKGHPYPVL